MPTRRSVVLPVAIEATDPGSRVCAPREARVRVAVALQAKRTVAAGLPHAKGKHVTDAPAGCDVLGSVTVTDNATRCRTCLLEPCGAIERGVGSRLLHRNDFAMAAVAEYPEGIRRNLLSLQGRHESENARGDGVPDQERRRLESRQIEHAQRIRSSQLRNNMKIYVSGYGQ